MAVVAVAAAAWFPAVGLTGAATPAAADTGTLTLTPAPGGADVSWPSQSGAYYYQLSVQDVQSGSTFTALTRQGHTQTHLSDLVAGDTYQVTVTAETSGAIVGSGTVTPVTGAVSSLPAPTVVSVAPQTLSSGAPALAVHLAAQSGARYEVASAVTPQWTVAARTFAAASANGETLILGPLHPATTYTIAVAGQDDLGSGTVGWAQGTTGSAGCSSGVCVNVGSSTTTQAFTANGLLDTVPTNASTYSSLRPAVFRLNTGYGSVPTAAQSVQATGAALIENLADAWYNDTYSGFWGGMEPPWECWSCYSKFITSQVQSIEAAGTTPAYWEVMNEPGTAGSYPAHLQGDAALYLQQLQVAAQAINAVDPTARILAPTDGTFLTGGTSLDKPQLTLDAVLANAASIPGLAGLDWHEISGSASPNVLTTDLAAARMLASLAGLPNLAMVVSEYTTPQDAPIPGADAGWLASLTTGNVTYADRACWTNQPVGTAESTCLDQLADGLFTATGALTAPGLVSTDYASLAGGQFEPAGSSDPGILALASLGGGTAHVLVGSAASCLAVLTGTCSGTTSTTSTNVTVTVPLSHASKARLVTVSPSAGAGVQSSTSVPFKASNGIVTVHLSLPYGAAGYLTIS